MQAIGGDHQIGTCRWRRPAASVGAEMDGGAAGVPLHVDRLMAGVYRVRPDALADRIKQQHLQVAAVDRKLRPVVAGELAARFAPDDFAALGGIDQFLRADSAGIQARQQAQFIEFAYRMGQHIDANAKRLDLRRRFIDPAIDTGGMQ